MSPLKNLITKLGESSSLSTQDVERCLRVLGFRGSINGLRQVLDFASVLAPYFQKFESYFSNLKTTLADFQRAKQLLKALEHIDESGVDSVIKSKYDATHFCVTVGGTKFHKIDFDKYPSLTEMAAFIWLIDTCCYIYPGISISEKFAQQLKYLNEFCEGYWTFAIEDNPELVMGCHIPLNENLNAWVNFSSEIIKQSYYAISTLDDPADGIHDAINFLKQIPETQDGESQPHISQSDDSSPTMQRGASLDERERLKLHHNSVSDVESKILKKQLREILEGKLFAPYFIEATLITLAIITGRTIQGALKFPMCESSNEQLVLNKLPGFYSDFNYPFWKRTLEPNITLELAFPEFLRILAYQPFRFNGVMVLEECLPYSLVNWEERCFMWLEQYFDSPGSSLDRKIRDELSRVIYQNTANSALLKWVATPVDKIASQVDSLSHYLNPINIKTIEAYSDACQEMFGKYGVKELIRNWGLRKYSWQTAENLEKIPEFFLNEIHSAENVGDLISYHNALSRYVLMLLIVATGHRKSTTPFFFPWDILHDENLVFICDKLTVGSEARFVPIPEWLNELVRAYHGHLQTLANYLRAFNPLLAGSINDLLKGETQSIRDAGEPTASSLQKSWLVHGQFFLVDTRFTAKSISTRDLEKYYAHLSLEGIRHYRKRIANSLWEKGASGFQIEAFLGHNASLHAFGESSAWSVMDWANSVRTAQETYLSENGWCNIVVKSFSRSSSSAAILTVPDFQKSTLSYDGRAISNEAAKSIARQIIRDLLPPEWFENENSEITEEDIVNLNRAAKEKLIDDAAAKNKVEQVISEEVEFLRLMKGKKISSVLTNLTRTEPGPIKVTSSRHHAIAVAVRRWWIDRLGSYANDPGENYLDRLAAIGMSLIVFDSVLDKALWRLLLTGIASHDARAAHECITLHTRVKRTSREYDKEVVLSQYTAAQIVGFENHHANVKPEENVVNAVTKRMEKWLKSAPHTGKALSLTQLFEVFKPWWMLRLSGTEFAISIGNYSGPATDLASAGTLYGLEVSGVYKDEEIVSSKILMSPIGDASSARRMMTKLFSDARGVFELKEQTNRPQRMRLIRYLNDSNEHATLKAIATQQPVVSALLDFFQYLLDEGGIRADIYAFSSLNTFYSHINKLIELWWDRSLDDFETEDFDEAYTLIIKNSSQAAFPIWYFHKFLRETYGVPHSAVASTKERTILGTRSSLISVEEFERAWVATSRINDDGQILAHSRSFLAVGYQYGLRPGEVLGLDVDNILPPKPYNVRVERNNIRDLKTKKFSLRVVSPVLANSKYQKHLDHIASLGAHAPAKEQSLFSDSSKKNSLYSRYKITQAATLALRTGTGNPSVVPHSMRHSAATRLAHFAIRSPRSIPLSGFVENALSDKDISEALTSCFSQGFFAWPFWMDRVAMFLGHASVDTLLKTYWHTSHIRLAEKTWHASESVKPTIQQMASMLGKERTTVNKKLSSLRNDSKSDVARINEVLIAHYVGSSKIAPFGCELMGEGSTVEVRKSTSSVSDDHEHSDQWVAFDRLLCRRLANGLTLEKTCLLSEQFDLSRSSTSAFLASYKRIVLNLGFDYFEPNNSELVRANSKNALGTIRSAAERERSLAKARAYIANSESALPKLQAFIALWIDRVRSESPCFVARDIEELELQIEMLVTLGASRDQFEFTSYDFDLATLRGVLTKDQLSRIEHARKRLSSGVKNVRVKELGIRVRQMQEATIGDYRDTQRLVLVLASIVDAGLLSK